MKQYILISAAALIALAACSKVTTGDDASTQREIRFAVANFAQTKANVEYDKETNFGTYAWLNDGSGTAQVFMINETVGYNEKNNVWTTIINPFYWPKTGNIDFISYSPFAGTNGELPAAPAAGSDGTANGQSASQEETPAAPEPVITRIKDKDYTFEYKDYRATGSEYDLMYADMAAAKTQNESTYTSISGVDGGVPTLFHHALSRISFRIKVNFIDDATPDSEATTTWEVKLQEADLYYVRHTGSLKLTMDANQAWVLPATKTWASNNGYEHIPMYRAPEQQDGQQEEIPGQLLTTEYSELLPEQFVLPQNLLLIGTPSPMLHIKLHITTTLSSGNVLTEVYDETWMLSNWTPDQAWKMNHRYLYTINIKPTAPGNNPDTPSDVSVLFDPETEDWVVVEPVFEIEL